MTSGRFRGQVEARFRRFLVFYSKFGSLQALVRSVRSLKLGASERSEMADAPRQQEAVATQLRDSLRPVMAAFPQVPAQEPFPPPLAAKTRSDYLNLEG